MANPVSFHSIFNFDDFNQSNAKDVLAFIRELNNAYKDFQGTVLNGQTKSFIDQQNELTKALREVAEQAERLNIANKQGQAQLLELIKTLQEHEAAIKKVNEEKKRAKDFENTLTDSVDGLTAQLKKQLDTYNALSPSNVQHATQMRSLADEIINTRKELKLLTDATKIQAEQQKASSDSVEGLRNKLKDLTQQYNYLSQSDADYSAKSKQLIADIKETSSQIRVLTDALKATRDAVTFAKGSYQELDAQTKKLKEDLLGMADGLNKNNAAAQALVKQIAANTEKLKEFDAALKINNRNVGNYSSAFDGLGSSLKSYALSIVGLYAIINGLQSAISGAYHTAVAFDAVASSIEFVSGSARDAEINMAFLRKTANDLGLDLEIAANGFRNLAAATKGTNLEGQRTRDIFQAVAKAASVMKLSNESVNGVFIALEQIVSKGRVSAEELRKQLGNRLPGAFELFAKGLNISTAELDKFLKKGIITKDALVPFAEQLEKTFGSGTERSSNSLQASINRLGNQMKAFYQSPGVIAFFKDMIDGAYNLSKALGNIFKEDSAVNTDLFQGLQKRTEALDNSLSPLLIKYDQLKDKTQLNTEQHRELQSVISQIANLLPGAVTGWDAYGNAIDINRDKVMKFADAQRIAADAMRKTAIKDLNGELQQSVNQGKAAEQVLNQGFSVVTRGGNPNISGSGRATKAELFNADGTLTNEGKFYYSQLAEAQKAIIEKAKAILELGGTLDKQTISFIDRMQGGEAEKIALTIARLQKVAEVNAKIEVAINKAASLVGKDDAARKKTIDELADLRNQRAELLDPGSTTRGKIQVYNPEDNKKAGTEAHRRMEAELAELKADTDARIQLAQKEFDNSRKTFTEEVKLEDDKIKVQADAYEKKKAIVEKYHGKVNESEAKYRARLKEALNEETATELKAQEVKDRIAKTIKDRHAEAIKAMDEYIDRLRKGREAIEKLQMQLGALKAQDKSKIGAASRVDGVLAMFGINNENAAFDAEQLQRNIAIGEKQEEGRQLSYEYNTEKAKSNADPEKLHSIEAAMAKNSIDMEKLLTDRTIAEEQRKARAKAAIWNESFKLFTQLASNQFEVAKQNLEMQRAVVEYNAAYELNLAGNNAAAKTKIDRDQHEKLLDIKRKEAEVAKEEAMFNIALSTAEGIAKALATYPWPFDLIVAGIVGAEGLAQYAAAANRNIPQYWRGREDGPEEFAEVNEQGPELINRKGKYFIAGGGERTVTHLEAGDKVYNAQKTAEMMAREHDNIKSGADWLDQLLAGKQIHRQREAQSAEMLAVALIQANNPTMLRDAIVSGFKKAQTNIYIDGMKAPATNSRSEARRARNTITGK